MASPAADDYLKTVYQHTEWQSEPITPSVLASQLGVAPSSVTEMVKKLAAAGLVNHVPYGAVRLTEAGERRALSIIRRHRLVETWLVQKMGYTWDEVHDEAEVLEHALSDRLLSKIDDLLGHPEFDPHGDRIPSHDGTIERPGYVLLAEAPDGHTGRILRVNDRDPRTVASPRASRSRRGPRGDLVAATGQTRWRRAAAARRRRRHHLAHRLTLGRSTGGTKHRHQVRTAARRGNRPELRNVEA